MIVVVVPAYNEGEAIGRVVRGLFKHGFTQVVVVDDGSADATAAQAFSAGATVVRHRVNRGQGAALETGNAYARAVGADIVVHFDGDGQFDPADIGPAIERLKTSQSDVILGSRFLDHRSRQVPFLKRFLVLPMSRLVNYFFTGMWLSDAHNGFRILNGRALELVRLKQDRMAHNTEIVEQIARHSLRFAEVPINVTYHRYGQRALGGFTIIKDLLVGLFVGRH